MKVWLFSDLHLEYASLENLPVPEADLCVAAGDILNKGIIPSMEWLNETVASHMPVVFVPGNHEYYRASIVESRKAAREAAANLDRVHLLDNASVVVGDILFVGSTLWTDCKLLGNPELAARLAMDRDTGMNDYRQIKYQKDPWRRFSPQMSVKLHQTGKAFLERTLQEATQRAVVVTHHAPSIRSIPADKKEDPFSALFASDLEDFIREHKPVAWFHGHIHQSSDYRIDGTRIVSNPHGYGDHEAGSSFAPALVLEI